MTKKEMFAEIRNAVIDNEEMVAFIDHEIELLGRKKGSSKPTKTQIENEAIKEQILTVLADCGEAVTVKEILGLIDGDYTSQKISALLRQLVMAEKVVKTSDKKVSRFALA